MSSWMGSYMANLLNNNQQATNQRAQSGRDQDQAMERMKFQDTLQRQRENEDYARKQFELNQNVSDTVRRNVVDQYPGLGLNPQEQGQLSDMQKQRLGLQDQMDRAQPFMQSGAPVGPQPTLRQRYEAGPQYAGLQPQMGGPYDPQKLDMAQEQGRQLDQNIGFLNKRAQGPQNLSVREIGQLNQMDRGLPKNGSSGLNFEQRMQMLERGYDRKQGLQDDAQEYGGQQGNLNRTNKLQVATISSTSREAIASGGQGVRLDVEKAKIMSADVRNLDAQISKNVTSINSLTGDPNTKQALVQQTQELMHQRVQLQNILDNWKSGAVTGGGSKATTTRNPTSAAKTLQDKAAAAPAASDLNSMFGKGK